MLNEDPQEYQRRYYGKRKTRSGRREELRIYHKNYYQKHREDWATKAKARYPSVRIKKIAYNNEYEKRRAATDPNFRIARSLRGRLRTALKAGTKAGSAVRDLGCLIPELKAHLEAKFYPHPVTGEAMTWENHSNYGWHIDHVVALAKFDLTDREQFLQAVNYKNLQPLWAEENLKKGAK